MTQNKPLFFQNQSAFRDWLLLNHENKTELWVGYYKKHTGKPSLTWPQSVDEGLCFGWIDGLRKSIDASRYMIRFTPRNPNSHWSHVNSERIKKLTKLGLVVPAGLAAYAKRTAKNTGMTAYEQAKVSLDKHYEKQILGNKKAWAYYSSLPPSTRKRYGWWIMNAKLEATRQRRIAVLIESSEKGEIIPAMAWGKRNK